MGGAATPGPGAGGRWLPLARLLAGRRWRRLHPRPGRRRGGGLRGWGVSCVPARSPRRGLGGRRLRGRSRSAPSATSHEQRPRERPRCRWPPLSPAGGRLAAPQHPLQTAPSRLEVRAGTAEGWDGEGRPAEDRRLSPLGALGPRLAPPRSRPCLSPALGRADCSLLPSVWSLEPYAAGARGPANPFPTLPHASPSVGRETPAWRQAQRGRFCGLGGMGPGDQEKTGPRWERSSFYLKNS